MRTQGDKRKKQTTECEVILYVAHMGWGCFVGVILSWEVRGETDESEAGNVAWAQE